MQLKSFSAMKKMAAESSDLYTLTDEDTARIQSILLGMMDDLDAFCRKNGLRYVMTGGCALGAVRHGGFIPWDDDIDICMPREDYDRFSELFLREYSTQYFVQEIRSCEKYDLNFMKVRLKGTVFCELQDPEPEKAGIFIDIFPIEHVYSSAWKRTVQYLYTDGLQFICSCMRMREKKKRLLKYAGDGEAAKMIRLKAAIGTLFTFRSFRSWLLTTERWSSRCKEKDSPWIAIPMGRGHFKGELYPIDWFYPPRQMDFSGHRYSFPAQIEKYLERMYGEYMKIPPAEEQEHHSVLSFELGQSE